MRISDCSSDVCSSDLVPAATAEESEKLLNWLESDGIRLVDVEGEWTCPVGGARRHLAIHDAVNESRKELARSEEHTSELQSLMRISYAVFCLKKKTIRNIQHYDKDHQSTTNTT